MLRDILHLFIFISSTFFNKRKKFSLSKDLFRPFHGHCMCLIATNFNNFDRNKMFISFYSLNDSTPFFIKLPTYTDTHTKNC